MGPLMRPDASQLSAERVSDSVQDCHMSLDEGYADRYAFFGLIIAQVKVTCFTCGGIKDAHRPNDILVDSKLLLLLRPV